MNERKCRVLVKNRVDERKGRSFKNSVELPVVIPSKAIGKKVGLLKYNVILLSVCIGNSSLSIKEINSIFPLV